MMLDAGFLILDKNEKRYWILDKVIPASAV